MPTKYAYIMKITGNLSKAINNQGAIKVTESKHTPAPVYESPDGGITIYKRYPGTSIKERVQIEFDFGDGWGEFLHGKNWDDMAEEFPAIREKLEELKVIVELCKK